MASSRAGTKSRRSRSAFQLPSSAANTVASRPHRARGIDRMATYTMGLTAERMILGVGLLLLIYPASQAGGRATLFAPASAITGALGGATLVGWARLRFGTAAFDRGLGLLLAALVPALYAIIDRGQFYSSASMWTAIASTAGIALLAVARRRPITVTELGVIVVAWIATRLAVTDGILLVVGGLLGMAAFGSSRLRRVGTSFLVSLSVIGCAAATFDLAWPIGQVNYLAVLVAMAWSAALADTVARPGRRLSFPLVVLSGAMLYLVFALGRGQTALVLAAGVVLVSFRAVPKPRRLPFAVGLGIALAIGATLIPWDRIVQHPKVGARLDIYRVALAGIAESPWLGEGVWGMHRALEHAPAARAHFWTFEATNLSNAHNVVLHALVQMGIVGTVGLGLLILFLAARARGRIGVPVAAAFGTWLLVGQVSIAPWTVVGLLALGFFLGWCRQARSTESVKQPASRRAFTPVKWAPTFALGLAFLVLGAGRPLHANWVTRDTERHDLDRLSWSIWNEESYNRYLTYVNYALLRKKQYDELYSLQVQALEDYGNRRTGWGRASRAAYYSGQPDLGAKHAMQQLAWTPLIVAQDNEVALFARAFRFPWGPETQKTFDAMDGDTRRNFIAMSIRPKIAPSEIDDVAARDDLTVTDLGYLLIVAKLRPDVPNATRRLALARLLEEYPHWDPLIALDGSLPR